MPFSLHHLMRRPEIPSEKPPLLLLLHGVGSNEFDLFALCPYLDKRFMVLSLRAPLPLGPNSHAWFPIEIHLERILVDAAAVERSRQALVDFIPQACRAYKADPEQVYLMGFSQGAIMSLSVMLSRPDLLAGVVAMSGRIPPEFEANMVDGSQLADFPIMVVHGERDEVIPVVNGRDTKERLESLPVDLTYKEYNMGHEINDDSLQDILTWLAERLNAGVDQEKN